MAFFKPKLYIGITYFKKKRLIYCTIQVDYINPLWGLIICKWINLQNLITFHLHRLFNADFHIGLVIFNFFRLIAIQKSKDNSLIWKEQLVLTSDSIFVWPRYQHPDYTRASSVSCRELMKAMASSKRVHSRNAINSFSLFIRLNFLIRTPILS